MAQGEIDHVFWLLNDYDVQRSLKECVMLANGTTLSTPLSPLRAIMVRLTFAGLLLLGADNLLAEPYKPMFSDSMLQRLDPDTRARFVELENENRRRWRNRNPQARDVAAAQRQHDETEAMLRRFEESRQVKAQAANRRPELSLEQQHNCETVAAEIAELSEGGVFYEADSDGGRRYLSDKEIAKRVKSQQKSYNKYCKG